MGADVGEVDEGHDGGWREKEVWFAVRFEGAPGRKGRVSLMGRVDEGLWLCGW